MNLQNRMIQHYFRLQEHERSLIGRAQRRKPLASRTALRQIELERQRLGRDLHTGVGQTLAATKLQLEFIDSQMPTPSGAVREALERVATLSAQALDQVRSVSRRLQPPEWQRLTLAEAIRQLWELSGLPQCAETSLSFPADLGEPDLETKILFYRAVQEALSNIARHSRASEVALSLAVRASRLVLTVHDNGVGFDVARVFGGPANLSAGIGLRSIREQAAALGGEMAVGSGADGTTLEVSVPFQPTSTGPA